MPHRQACWIVVLAAWAASLGLWGPLAPLPAQSLPAGKPHWRLPVELKLDQTGNWLAVGNRRSSTVSLVDLQSQSVVAEIRVGRQLSDLDRLAGTDILLATDAAEHRLRFLRWEAETVHVDHELSVSQYPETVVSDSRGQQIAVASLWSRRVTLCTPPTANEPPRIRWVTDLEFAPQELLFVQDDKLVVAADAFGGSLALIDAESGEIVRVRRIPAHKIRGLAATLDGQRLIVSHQMLNSLAHTIRNDVHWGLLMSNDLRWLNIDVLLSQDQNFYKDSHMHPIGQAGAGMGDPAGVAMATSGTVAVAIAGVNQVVIGQEDDFSLQAVEVGPGPTAVVFTHDGQQLLVANQFDDSISVVDVQEKRVTATLSLGPTPEPDELLLGERLFHDATLAHDGWMSCSSCHVKGHTNGQLNDNLSDKSFGAPKRVLTLLGNAGTEPLAWNGSKSTMEEQVEASIKLTMQGPRELTPGELKALATYVQSLQAPPPLLTARALADPAAIGRGEVLFAKLDCNRCHQPPLFTSADVFDVGLEDEEGNREFNPPSLRGLSQRAPYFHDNRASTLEDVFRKHQHQLAEALSDQELADLIAFLQSL